MSLPRPPRRQLYGKRLKNVACDRIPYGCWVDSPRFKFRSVAFFYTQLSVPHRSGQRFDSTPGKLLGSWKLRSRRSSSPVVLGAVTRYATASISTFRTSISREYGCGAQRRGASASFFTCSAMNPTRGPDPSGHLTIHTERPKKGVRRRVVCHRIGRPPLTSG